MTCLNLSSLENNINGTDRYCFYQGYPGWESDTCYFEKLGRLAETPIFAITMMLATIINGVL
jgi:hypothetical protein